MVSGGMYKTVRGERTLVNWRGAEKLVVSAVMPISGIIVLRNVGER